jgi:hypothetical protein
MDNWVIWYFPIKTIICLIVIGVMKHVKSLSR